MALSLATRCKAPFQQTVAKEENRKETVTTLPMAIFAGEAAWLPRATVDAARQGFGEKPMMLLTTQLLRRNRTLLWRILRCYMKRWSIKQSIRFAGQGDDLENIRVLTYRRLRNMIGCCWAYST